MAETEHELTEQEEQAIEGVLDTFEKHSSEVRLAMFEALLANYCHECGSEQPDDPDEDCPCLPDEDEEDDELDDEEAEDDSLDGDDDAEEDDEDE